MTGTMLRSAPITPEGCAIVAASRPAAWLLLTVRAGRGPASPAAPRPGTPNPGRGPAGCLLDGLPPGRRPRQGRCGTRCAPFLASLRDRLRRPLTRPSSRRPGETRSPGAGEEQRPTSRQEARTVADQAGTPTPAGTC